MSELTSVVERVRSGDANSFEILVRRFQDMAAGYSYSILRDMQLAEDAAQEAFFEAFRTLDNLREPAAFPGWFRRIVFKQCDRLTRNKQLVAAAIDAAIEASAAPEQLRALEQREMKDRIWKAVDSLPEHERETLVLFYISGYSHKEVSEFLGVPVSTTKKRLHSARNRLRDLLVDEVENILRESRPSRSESFAKQVLDLLKAARAGDANRVKELLRQNPRLIAARDPLGNTALIVAVNSGHQELAEMLFEAGVRPDFHEAAAIGRNELVEQFLSAEPDLLDRFSAEGFTALALAAHFGHAATTRLLIDRGADVNVVSGHAIGVTTLHAALFGSAMFGGKAETAKLLLDNGADVNARRGGKGWPRAGWTALHYCAFYGFVELIDELIDRGAEVNACDDEGKTPLQTAIEAGQSTAVELLQQSDARH